MRAIAAHSCSVDHHLSCLRCLARCYHNRRNNHLRTVTVWSVSRTIRHVRKCTRIHIRHVAVVHSTKTAVCAQCRSVALSCLLHKGPKQRLHVACRYHTAVAVSCARPCLRSHGQRTHNDVVHHPSHLIQSLDSVNTCRQRGVRGHRTVRKQTRARIAIQLADVDVLIMIHTPSWQIAQGHRS
jgi:hypothetical protein